MPYGNMYTVELRNQAVTGAITLIQILAGASGGLQLVRAKVSQRNLTAVAMQPVQLNRKSTAATVTAAVLATTILDVYATGTTPSVTLSVAGTGINATAEGVDTDVVFIDDWNVLIPWEVIWLPEDRPFVKAGGVIALKFPAAPTASTTVDASVTFLELG